MRRCKGEIKKRNPKRGHQNHRGKGIFEFFGHTAYLALIAARDPAIRALLDQGFAFVTNAFKTDAAPSGMKSRTDREHIRRLQQAGYQVEVSTAYDEQGHSRPTLSAIWRKKPEKWQPRKK
jgi:hypothetical protein